MRLNKQKVFRTALVGYFLASTFILSGAAFANTEASEEVSTVPSTTQSEKAVSSSGPELPTLNSSKEDVPTTSSPKVEEPKRELTYEDNRMLEEPKADSPVPAAHFQEKQLENGLTIKGSVSAGAEVRENVPSRTILSALILQRLTEAGTWQEVHRFSIEGSGVNVTDSAFSFDYEKPVTETGESNYRLAADYIVKYSEEDQEQQKASLEVGTVTKAKEEIQEKPSETASSSQESTNSEQGSTEVTKENTVESSGPKEEANAEEPIVIDPSTMGTGDDSPKTLGSNNQIPAMQNNYREAFQRGMGIMPMASPIVSPTITNPHSSSGDSSIRVDVPTVISAQYTSRTKATMKVQLVWDYMGFGSGMSIDENTATTEIDKKTYAFTVTLGNSRWAASAVKGDLKLSSLTASSTDGYYHGRLSKLTNQRTITVEHPNMFRWEGWSKNVTEFEFTDLPVGDITWLEFAVKPNYTGASYFEFGFTAPTIADLTEVSQPVFTATNGVTTSVTMDKGSYTGDISDVTNDGLFKLSTDGVNFFNHVSVNHDKDKDKFYHSTTIPYLGAGTGYYGKVVLKDWLENPKESKPSYFCTPNSVNTPTKKSETIPTTSTNASTTFEGTYTVGATLPAHAKLVEVYLSKDLINWSLDTVASTTATIDTTNKKVTYTHKGLNANQLYYTRFRVKNQNENDSNKPGWSAVSTNQTFKTRGISLDVSTPTLDQANVTTNQIMMKSGTYTGQISTDPADINSGFIRLSKDNESTWSEYTKVLPHQATLNGTYAGLLLQSLNVGTTYKVQVGLKNDWRTYIFSKSGTFYTKNSVNKPIIDTLHLPTSRYNASATISGVYGIGPAGTTPAHPDKVKVQVKLDGAPNWEDVDSSSSPKLDSQSINTSSTKGTFTISKLKASTKYHVRYQVENQGGWSDWSASEEFVTLAPPPVLKIIDAPKLDFGMLQSEKFTQTANLSAASQKNHLTVDNTDTTKGWKLTAALQQLKRTDNPSIVMPWAKLTMPINLQNSTDDGITWSNYATGVDGIPRTMSFNSGDPAQKLWGIVNPTDAQGFFRTEIDWSNVELEVPGNQYELYEGKLVWSLDDTP